jgi:hypothetical protein
MLSSRIGSLRLPKNALSAFYAPYASGGIFGFYASGSPSAAAGYLETAVAELKSIAAGQGNVEGHRLKVALETGAVPKDVVASTITAAASGALKATPSYAVYGTTYGAPSYATISKLVKA